LSSDAHPVRFKTRKNENVLLHAKCVVKKSQIKRPKNPQATLELSQAD